MHLCGKRVGVMWSAASIVNHIHIAVMLSILLLLDRQGSTLTVEVFGRC